jgi:hypothetical protein
MFKLVSVILTFLLITNAASAWKYQTKCTKHTGSPNTPNKSLGYSSIVDDFVKDEDLEVNSYDNFATKTPASNSDDDSDKILRLKCPNINDFLFIGLTQYGVSNSSETQQCQINANDCLISVDYISNQCNGLNTCDIQLDSQFLHSCKNHSDYINIAYECIPGSKRMDVCSNDETFIIDSSWNANRKDGSLNNRFGSFYLSSPNYPNEYANNLNNCSCKLEYVKIDAANTQTNGQLETQDEINLQFKSYEFDLEEGEDANANSIEEQSYLNSLRKEKCTKDSLRIESVIENKDEISASSINLCGQYKDFKEFYAKGTRFNFNFNTDDVITRRGFLLKVEPTAGNY